MIPARDLARMMTERGSTPQARASAVVEAVMLRKVIDHVDDNLASVEFHARGKQDRDHEILADLCSDIRHRIETELRNLDRFLVERLTR